MTSRGRTRAAVGGGYSRGVDDPDPPPLLSRSLSWSQLIALDGVAAATYTALLLTLTISGAGRTTGATPDVPLWTRCVVAAGIGLPLAVRRLWPRTVFGAVVVASVVAVLGGLVFDSFVGAGLAAYVVALTRPRPPWEPTLAIALLSALAALWAVIGGAPRGPWAAIPVGGAVIGGAWTIGRAVRERRAHATRAAAQLAGQAATDERLRIARELHDIVAHSMGLIAVKAGVANHLAGARPEEAHEALRVIETTSRSALAEMRQMLGVLRSGADAGEAAANLAPAPGVAGLRALAEQASMAGVRVSMEVRRLDQVPEGVGVSVHRIVQEALTNVVKHAAPAGCRVIVEASAGAVAIEVTDDGPGRRVLPQASGQAHGLIGIRERVALYGGTFAAGPRPEGGFAVSVTIPYALLEGVR
jgi:signal transduction histidine kinase